MKIRIETFQGKKLLDHIDALAKLRIRVFKEYPYLYLGNNDSERDYLKTYADCSESVMILVFDADQVVGASTAIPLAFETPEVKAPFQNGPFNIDDIFYLGESVLLPEYRGQKIYRVFFTERENAACSYGSKIAAFCSVDRDPNDPRRPANFQPQDPVWRHFKYIHHPELKAYFEWKEIGESTPSQKSLSFWLKELI